MVIKTLNSYYIYPIEKTPLNFILDKNFLLNKIHNLNERNIDNKFINFNFFENDNEINLFFDKNTFNFIGWQTVDIYQNLSITYLNSIIKNKKLKKDIKRSLDMSENEKYISFLNKYFIFKKIRNVDAKSVKIEIIEEEELETNKEGKVSSNKKQNKKIRLVE